MGGPPELQGTIHGALAQSRYLAGDTLGAFRAVGAALDAIPPGGGGAIEAELLFSYGIAGRPREELMNEVRGRLSTPRLGAEGEPTPAEVVRRHLLALDGYLRGDREQAVTEVMWAAERMSDPALADGLPSLTGTGPAFVLAGLDAHADAERLIVGEPRAGAAPRQGGWRRRRPCTTASGRAGRRGDLVGGLADAETIFAMTEGAWEVAKLPLLSAQTCMKVERGEVDEAAARLDLPESLECAARVPGAGDGCRWAGPGSRRLGATGTGPCGFSLRAGERLLAIDAPSPGYCWWRSQAAQAAMELGQLERATALAAEQLELGRRIGSPRAIGTGLAALGSVQGGAEGVELLRASLCPAGDGPGGPGAGAGAARPRHRPTPGASDP